jgi:hypothetical protein
MITDLIQGSFYDVFKNDGILLVENIEYSGRGDDEKFIFMVTVLEQNGEGFKIEVPLSKNNGYIFVLKNVQQ